LEKEKMAPENIIQLNVRFPRDQDVREELRRAAQAEDRSVQSLIRCFIVEGLRARLRTDRIAARV
jgi:CopG-like RHH_1 or ribbon-helix-helix domain, RHH_5